MRVIDGNGNATTTTFDAIVGGLLETTVTDPLAHAVKQRTDGAGLVRMSIDALNHATLLSYDANGNRVSIRDPNGTGEDCVIDARNRDIACTDLEGATTARTYDRHSNVTSTTDGLGNVTSHVFDARNRKVSTLDRIAGTTRFSYDTSSNLLTITDAEGRITRYAYTPRNELTSEEFPPGQATPKKATDTGAVLPVPGIAGNVDYRAYTYDAGRRLLTRLDQQGVLTTYGYDRANRLTARAYPDALNDTFAYDDASRLTSAASYTMLILQLI